MHFVESDFKIRKRMLRCLQSEKIAVNRLEKWTENESLVSEH